jgi:hypothetical protein
VAVLALPAQAAAAVSFTQTGYTLQSYEPSHGVGSEIGGSNSLYEANTPVAVGDMNGDGKPDILASDYEANQIYVLLNDGAGHFSPAPGSPYFSGTCLHPDSLLTGEFTGDGKRDLLVTCGAFKEEIQLFEGDGTGAVSPTTTNLKGEGPMFVGNLDGDTELVYDKNPEGTCTLDIENLKNPGNQDAARLCLGAPQWGSSAHWFTSLCGGDEWLTFGGTVGSDRGIELAAVEHDSEPLHQCDATATSLPFDSGIPFLTAIANGLGTADLNGDGVPDVVATDAATPGAFHVVGVTSSESGLSFAAPAAVASPANITGFGVADFNGDGKLDLMAGEFHSAVGEPDLIVVDQGTGSTTAFEAPQSIPVFGRSGQDTYPKPVVADLNGDGKPDIVTDGSQCNAEETSCSTQAIVLLNGTPGGGPGGGGSEPGGGPGTPGGGSTGGGSGLGKFLGIPLKGVTLKVHKGSVTLKLTCPATAAASCVGRATLATIRAYAVSVRHKRKLVLGSKPFSIPAGHTLALTIKLTSKALKLLAARHLVPAREVIAAHDASGHAVTTTATVKLALAKGGQRR